MAQKTRGKKSHFLGFFTVPNNQSVIGDLQLKRSDTVLNIYSDEELQEIEFGSCIKGVASTGEHLTLIDCYSPGVGHSGGKDGGIRYHARIFPHYVAVGDNHIAPDKPSIKSISFTTTDLETLFHDFDAFGHVTDAKPILNEALKKQYKNRSIETGEWPIVLYFTGKSTIAEMHTTIGKISIHHCPSYNMGGPKGVYIKNRLVVSIEPENPTPILKAIDSMDTMASFLSMAAGRAQGITHIHVITTEFIDDRPNIQVIHPKFPWKASKSSRNTPHPTDVPLDPIQHQAEFSSVLIDWIERHSGWRIARARYLGCLRKNEYGPERLVAAANMFDLLPAEDVPTTTELHPELIDTRDECILMFRQHPYSIDRDSALSSLGRLGKPSLPKKIAYRVSIIEAVIGNKFPELQGIAKLAVQGRNHFVHGSSESFDYQKLEEFVPFLTDALEFIFAASDFIQAGWDAARWASSSHIWGHSFARFLSEYRFALAELRKLGYCIDDKQKKSG